MQGLQALTMTNAGGTQPGTTILQYAQTSDGQQILVPSNQVVVQSEYLVETVRNTPRWRWRSFLTVPPFCVLRCYRPSCIGGHADVPDPHHANDHLPSPDRGDDVSRHSDIADK